MKIDMDYPWIIENEKGKVVAVWEVSQTMWYEHDEALQLAKWFLEVEGLLGKYHLRRKRTGKRLYRTRYILTVYGDSKTRVDPI
jgi:hypothetical protein